MKGNRLITLLSLLQSGRSVPGVELANRLSVTERTVRRDVAALRELGYRIDATSGPEGGYALMRGTRLPPLLFDEEQIVALAIALQAIPPVDGIADGAERALTTVRQLLPSRLASVVDRYRMAAPAPEGGRVATATLSQFAVAIQRCETIAVTYLARGITQPQRRHLEPHHVVHHADNWYLVAWDLDRDDWRIFRLDRLRPSIMPGARFARRNLPKHPSTFVREQIEGRAWECVGVVVMHAPMEHIASWAHPEWTLEELTPTRIRVTAAAWNWVGLIAWLSQYDVAFTIEGPTELAEAARTLSDRLLAATDTDGPA